MARAFDVLRNDRRGDGTLLRSRRCAKARSNPRRDKLGCRCPRVSTGRGRLGGVIVKQSSPIPM